MKDFVPIYLQYTMDDGGEYVMKPLRVLMAHGWRPALNVFSYSFFEGYPHHDGNDKRVDFSPDNPDEFWQKLRWAEENKADIIDVYLFWQDTKQYINMDFRPEGMSCISLRAKCAPIQEEVQLVMMKLVKPLEDSNELDLLTCDCMDENWDRSELADIKMEFGKTYKLNTMLLEPLEINSDVLQNIEIGGTGEINWHLFPNYRISFERSKKSWGIGAHIPLNEAPKLLELIRQLALEIVSAVPKSSKVSDGPHARYGTHGVEVKLYSPTMEQVLGFVRKLLFKVYTIHSEEKTLFLYGPAED